MPETHPLDIIDNHLLARIDGGLALLDTGSPTSIGNGREFTAGGRMWCPHSAQRFVLDAASGHLDTPVEWLLGHDFFADHKVLLDWPGRRLVLDPAPEDLRGGSTHEIEFMMGVPILRVRHKGQDVRAVLDSGAALSYAPSSVTGASEQIGTHRDFYPGFGEFETGVWSVPITIGECELTIEAGELPPLLAVTLGVFSDGWIVGSDFFRNASVLVDYAGGCVARSLNGRVGNT